MTMRTHKTTYIARRIKNSDLIIQEIIFLMCINDISDGNLATLEIMPTTAYSNVHMGQPWTGS